MSIHKKNLHHLTYIIKFLNKFSINKVPSSQKDIKKIYESQFYIANTFLYIFDILSRPIKLKKKKIY